LRRREVPVVLGDNRRVVPHLCCRCGRAVGDGAVDDVWAGAAITGYAASRAGASTATRRT